MNFAEIIFLPFLAIVLVLDRLLPTKRMRLRMLLIASCIFYGWWKIELLPLLFVTAVLDFFLARWMFKIDNPTKRKRVLAASVVANLGLLGFFKYSNFAITTVNDLAHFFGHSANVFDPLDLILPVGISFYTFQSMSYTIDVYKREIQPDPSLSRFLTFVTLFPQLVAGPIVRASVLLPQLQDGVPNPRRPAIFLILFGLFKKLLIADTLGALLVDPTFANPSQHGSAMLWLAAYGYAFQIFCDFSGYSDIAIGCGRLLGFDFPQNFNAPYLSQSISEFWRRWHITLGSWFRDYVYVPLGGSRGSLGRWVFASMAVFLLSGLWHGASFNFIIWGGAHGLLFVTERLVKRLRPASQPSADSGPGLRVFKTLATFHFVTLAWIFFRAPTLPSAVAYLSGMFAGRGVAEALAPGVGLALAAAVLLHVLLEPWVENAWQLFNRMPALAQGAVAIALGVVLYANSDSAVAHRAFIYFQF